MIEYLLCGIISFAMLMLGVCIGMNIQYNIIVKDYWIKGKDYLVTPPKK